MFIESKYHGAGAGLDQDDHVQYLLVDGSRAMSGALNMGTNRIDNITALRILDNVDQSHYAELTIGDDLTGNKNLIVNMGDANRTITLSGNPTLADWFDQSVKTISTPTFDGITLDTGTKTTLINSDANGSLTVGGITGQLSTRLRLKAYDGSTTTAVVAVRIEHGEDHIQLVPPGGKHIYCFENTNGGDEFRVYGVTVSGTGGIWGSLGIVAATPSLSNFVFNAHSNVRAFRFTNALANANIAMEFVSVD